MNVTVYNANEENSDGMEIVNQVTSHATTLSKEDEKTAEAVAPEGLFRGSTNVDKSENMDNAEAITPRASTLPMENEEIAEAITCEGLLKGSINHVEQSMVIQDESVSLCFEVVQTLSHKFLSLGLTVEPYSFAGYWHGKFEGSV